jgi:hypothetical protein
MFKLIDLTLQCRPSDPWEFASVFFVDEQSIDNKLAHALHSLPFLMNHDPTRFRQCACTIFCIECDDAISNSDSRTSSMGEIGIENLRKIVNLVLVNRNHLISPLSMYFPTSDFIDFAAFENVLKLCISAAKYSEALQAQLAQFEETSPSGNVDAYIEHLKSKHTTLKENSADNVQELQYVLSSIEGAETYRRQRHQDTTLWTKMCINCSVQLFLQNWASAEGVHSPRKLSV